MPSSVASVSRSPSPISPSPALSETSGDEYDTPGSHTGRERQEASASRPDTPLDGQFPQDNGQFIDPNSDDSATCMWSGCGLVFNHLPSLVEHIHNVHIGVHKSNYTCEWATCPRKGLAQTSRFALISHLRSHTGEKPFVCPRPECDKSFTRSDALAKHLRLQHNISPPPPGRGGSRKRKRPLDEHPIIMHTPVVRDPTVDGSAFTTFKIETRAISPMPEDYPFGHPLQTIHSNIRTPSPPRLEEDPSSNGQTFLSFNSDSIPLHLMKQYDQATHTILGRNPEMVRYLLMKAKYRYAFQQNEGLEEELRVVRAELQREREEKEAVLNQVLRSYFGSEAEALIDPIPLPESMLAPSTASPTHTHVNGSVPTRLESEEQIAPAPR